LMIFYSFLQAEDGIRVFHVTGVQTCALPISGMPAISDPGFPLVAAATEAGVAVTALPGPSAVLTALAVSGLPTDRFCFEGFLPRSEERRVGKECISMGCPLNLITISNINK